MTFAPTRYLDWAIRYYGKVPFDLASSGIPAVPFAEIGMPEAMDDPAAWETLRARIGAYHGVNASETMPALGTTHAVWLAYASVLSAGDELLVEDPTYEPIWRIAEGMGLRVNRFERPIAERCALDPARIAAAMTPRTRLVSITNLHNPSGARASDDTLRAIARIAEGRGAKLLVNEVYAPFDDWVDANGVWGKTARHLASNVLVIGSLTKCYGLGAHRIGWLVGPEDVIERARAAMISNVGHLPNLYSAIAVRAFDRIGALADRARARLRGKREHVASWMATRGDLSWTAPEAGIFGFAVSHRAGDLRPLLELCIEEHGVLVAPGSFFGVPNGFRLSWSIDGEKLGTALDRLGSILPKG